MPRPSWTREDLSPSAYLVIRLGCEFYAVEPTDGMREVLSARHLPGVTVLDGRDVAMRWHEQQPYEVGMDFRPVVASGPFIEAERRQFHHHQSLDRSGLIERVLTTSYIAAMSPAKREALMADVNEVVRRLPEVIDLPYVTDVYRATAER